MKKTILLTTVVFIFISLRLDAKPEGGISFNFFYSSLRPYGEWIQLDNDLVVWRPSGIPNSWRPYSNGRWCWTSNGWYWDSFEPFGWATYHYGRWYDDDNYGWIWIPDYDWGPSWVEWRYDEDYIGWAPLPPYASFSIDFGIHFSIGWHSNYRYWNFITYNRFCDHRINNYLLDEQRVEKIFEHTKYRTNYYSERDRIINGGVDRSFIERKAGNRITEREIATIDNVNDYNRARSDRGDRVYAYRPSEREVTESRNIDRFDIRRGDSRSTIEKDKVRVSLSRDASRDLNLSNERTVERNRDANVDRGAIQRNENRNPNELRRNIQKDQPSRNVERQRNAARERAPIFEKPNRSERFSTSERKIEPRKGQSYSRPTPRVEARDKGPQRSTSREKEKSAERKR